MNTKHDLKAMKSNVALTSCHKASCHKASCYKASCYKASCYKAVYEAPELDSDSFAQMHCSGTVQVVIIVTTFDLAIDQFDVPYLHLESN